MDQQVKRLGGTVSKKSKLYSTSKIISIIYLIVSIICIYTSNISFNYTM